ncbi:MAG: bifunctional UDP-N-acetylglucosamine diphosphorylase/glucosamine-1-phosphate N-acetyltransferase GlmU [Clostridiales bacterium]|nr:bifunctional UDP-N-acetylglucosamine diphosphorylase/glucosamine-1-phosphate N-acetyltransferase GlmU [Clostridiales bacterium]
MQKIAIVLAAGKGTRMKSAHAKAAHQLCGKPMIAWVCDAVRDAGYETIYVVCGHRADEIQEILGDSVTYVQQDQQLGTGHAVQVALAAVTDVDQAQVLVTCGDTPLLRSETLEALTETSNPAAVRVLSTVLADPFGYGRIVREKGAVCRIVEEKDANEQEKGIQEINVGTYVFDLGFLRRAIQALTTDNAQGELYLTDLIASAHVEGVGADAFLMPDANESLGVNNRKQLARAQGLMQMRINDHWLDQGVSMTNPAAITIEADVSLEADVTLEAPVALKGHTSIASGTVIGMNCELIDAQIGQDCHIKQAVIWDAIVGKGVNIGPFAYLRPGTILADQVKIGDFVEVKNSHVGQGSKIPHLSYMGDADIGSGVNIGCGSITCNYDGKKKYRTTIEDHAFIGSNTNLIAPVTVGQHAYIAAGATIRKDVKGESLSFMDYKLKTRDDWNKDK